MSVIDTFITIATGLRTTLVLTVSAFLFGAVIAIPITGARTSRFGALRVLAGSYIEIARGIPPIVWLFILFFGLNQFGIQIESMTAAIVGLGIVSGGYIAEIYRAGLKAIPPGQHEAAQALALPHRAAFVWVTVPQAIVTVTPLALAFFIGLLKDSAVASIIGVQDITAMAVALSKRSFEGFTIFLIAGVVYLVISLPIAAFGRWLGHVLTERWAVRT